jgi:hypothetical protein
MCDHELATGFGASMDGCCSSSSQLSLLLTWLRVKESLARVVASIDMRGDQFITVVELYFHKYVDRVHFLLLVSQRDRLASCELLVAGCC